MLPSPVDKEKKKMQAYTNATLYCPLYYLTQAYGHNPISAYLTFAPSSDEA